MYPSLLASVFSTTILTFVYILIYFLEKKSFIKVWSLAWYCCLIRYILLLSANNPVDNSIINLVTNSLFLLSGLLMLLGTFDFLNRKLEPKFHTLYLAAVLYLVMSYTFHLSEMYTIIPVYLIMGSIYIWTGIAFLKNPIMKYKLCKLIGFAFIILGMHEFDYPITAYYGLLSYGFLIASFLQSIIAVSMILLYYQDGKVNLLHIQRMYKRSEERLNNIINNQRNVLFELDNNYTITFISPFVYEMTGYKPEEVVGLNYYEFFQLNRELNYDQQFINKYIKKDGIEKYFIFNTNYIESESFNGTFGSIADVTDKENVEINLILQKAYFQQLFEDSPQAIAIVDNNERIVNVNREFEKIFQYKKEELQGGFINEFIVSKEYLDEASILTKKVTSGETVKKETKRKRKSGQLIDVSTIGYPILIDNRQIGLYIIYTDISERKSAENKYKYLSMHDSLTSLFNRNYFEQEMIKINDMQSCGIIMCDIDGLKLTNESLGQKVGDYVLITVANILNDIFKDTFDDDAVIARTGGDEFSVLLRNTTEKEVENICSKIEKKVSECTIKTSNIPINVSIGASIGDYEHKNTRELFKEAENSMYRDKLNNSNSVRSSIVETLTTAMDARDYSTENHSERLQKLVEMLANSIGLNSQDVNDICLFARFHDIGKVGIPDRILFKPGPLNNREIEEMRRHSEIGYRIASSSPDLVYISDWILKHHEWWNGKGYPLGLSKKNIPVQCRILTIADAYDAMVNDRPYRKAMSKSCALEEIKRCAGQQFDPELADKFIEIIKNANI